MDTTTSYLWGTSKTYISPICRPQEMAKSRGYTAQQKQHLANSFYEQKTLTCPECDILMDHLHIPPRSDVSYVRDRTLLTCPSCQRTLIVDHAQRD